MNLGNALQSFYRFLFARPRFEKWNRFVFHLSLRGLGVLNYENSSLSGERFLVDELLPKWLDGSPVVFDVGAHVGAYSSLIAKRLPDARVHAFEPNPSSRQQFDAPDGVTLHPLALGAQAGVLVLFDRAGNEGSSHASVYPEVISEIHHAESKPVEVTVVTLDDAAAELGVGAIDFLKIDVEGHELAVLSGAKRLLAAKAIGIVQFEFNEMNVVSRSFLRDFRLLLPDHELFRLLPKGLLPLSDVPISSELFGYQNIVAVPKGFAANP